MTRWSASNACNDTCCFAKRASRRSKTPRPFSRSISMRCLQRRRPASRGGAFMLKALVNEARLRLDITTMGPLLIKTGYATIIGADMAPVQTYRNGQREVYLPGSSLKGVFRSHIEKVINSIKPQTACNPLSRLNEKDTRDDRRLYRVSCGARFNSKTSPLSPQEVYADSCPTSRLFGSTSF